MVLYYPLKTIFFFFTTACKVLHKLTPVYTFITILYPIPNLKIISIDTGTFNVYMVPQSCYACSLLKAFALAMSLS